MLIYQHSFLFQMYSQNYFEGEASELDYSKIDLIYKKRSEGLSKEQKCKVEQDIINFINQWRE